MTTQDPIAVPRSSSVSVGFDPVRLNSDKDRPLTDEERERIREYYRSLNFKEFLAACPIDGIDLTREPEFPREVEF